MNSASCQNQSEFARRNPRFFRIVPHQIDIGQDHPRCNNFGTFFNFPVMAKSLMSF